MRYQVWEKTNKADNLWHVFINIDAPSMVLYITMRLFDIIAVLCDIYNKSYKQEK